MLKEDIITFNKVSWIYSVKLAILLLVVYSTFKKYLIFQKPTDKCCTDYYIKHLNTINTQCSSKVFPPTQTFNANSSSEKLTRGSR